MVFKDVLYDKQLNIKTSGRDDSIANNINYPYEPTDYCVLERIANSGYIGKRNIVIDYGCGKGRASFFLAWQTGCKVVGIEYDERLYNAAMHNLEKFSYPYRVSFECINAKEYDVPDEADVFYFFNPFSTVILRKVIGKIVQSYYRNARAIYFLFYYPSNEYISYLMSEDELDFFDEIDCKDLFEGSNKRERVIIFSKGC